ncbi:MAG TPA: hypothetical protein PLG50_05410 [bacterium]|nr:hypothetical protein [bacterium]HQG45074.1 hypothetical protein [bacterium]HQI47206.1 hypothetical protein [bacterium]HQJ65168.1 hypothetical protein [bacterium]
MSESRKAILAGESAESVPSLHEWLALMNERTSRQALELAEGPEIGFTDLVLHPLGRFLRIGLLEGRLLQGFDGFRAAWIAALQLMLLNMKIWHLQQHHEERERWGEQVRP